MENHDFDAWARAYDRSVLGCERAGQYPFAGYAQTLSAICQRIFERNSKKVLDVGIGTGALAKKLYDGGVEIVGIDFSGEMLAIAREKMPLARLVRHDFRKGLPAELDGERFDAIVCTYAIHHLADGEKTAFIQALKERLNPEGEILIGDVAFASAEELEKCRKQNAERWDGEESYIVADRLAEAVPGLRFVQTGGCSGICVLGK